MQQSELAVGDLARCYACWRCTSLHYHCKKRGGLYYCSLPTIEGQIVHIKEIHPSGRIYVAHPSCDNGYAVWSSDLEPLSPLEQLAEQAE